MDGAQQQIKEYEHQADLQRLKGLRPIDDDFMRCLFKNNIELAEFVLRIITGKEDLVITECQTQKDMKRLVGARSVCLDAYGTDSSGKKYDLEIQREDKGANPHRARYHSSVLDIENLSGVNEMCKALEEMRNETAENTLLQMIRNLMETTKWNAERAMEALKVPLSEQEKYKAKL